MPSTFKDTDPSSSREAATTRPASGSAQTVALEVPVTVNGVRPVEGSDKREPFFEATKTVLVHNAGAVIRLSSAVLPGQLLFLTNDKTKKEVVCQVVKSKSHGNVSGYVELEFTEPVQGFWGLGFPAERAGLPAATRPAVLAPLGQNMDSRPAVSNVLATPIDVSAAIAAEEFKTEIKPDSRPMNKADFLAPADSTTQALKIEASRLQEQLSSLQFADPSENNAPRTASTPAASERTLSDATAKIFEIASEPMDRKPDSSRAPAELATPTNSASKALVAATPAFDAEEVKIPAWLEPLARNAAIPEPAEAAPLSATSEFEELSASEPQQPPPALTTRAAVSAPRTVPTTPVFGRTLLATPAGGPAKASRGNKGFLIAAIAAGIVLAAAGVTWYLRQSSSPVANEVATNSSLLSTPAATLPTAPAPIAAPPNPAASSGNAGTTENLSSDAKPKSSASGSDLRVASSSSPSAKLQPAAISERVPKSDALVDPSKTPSPSAETEEPENKRPNLGNVRLAKPKVSRGARTPLNADAAPTLEADSEQFSSGESALSGALLEGSAKQPAAPAGAVPVGGDVVTARLISSVPPAYPALARTQHIAGDVRVDALIDANGRVSAMKVVSGPSMLHQAAMDALRQWKYQPAKLDGKPVAMHLTVTIQFRLQ